MTAENVVKPNEYAKDAEGNIWLCIGTVTDEKGERAILRPAQPIVRFNVDLRSPATQKPLTELTRLDEVTITERLVV